MNDCIFPTPIFQRPFAGMAASPRAADRKHPSISSTLRKTMHANKRAGGLSPSSLLWGSPGWRGAGIANGQGGHCGTRG